MREGVSTLVDNTIVLVGDLGALEAESLTAYCGRLHQVGQRRVRLDMAGVRDCHRSGLDGLLELVAGAAGLAVTVEGASWAQFMLPLSEASPDQVDRLCAAVRGLVGQTARRPHRAV
jgi:hypothetical protein